MEAKELYIRYANIANTYGVSLDTLLLLKHSSALKRKKYKMALKIQEAYKMERKPLKLIK